MRGSAAWKVQAERVRAGGLAAACAAALAGAAVLASGCATGGSGSSPETAIRVKIGPSGVAESGGRSASIAGLPGLVRAQGARRETWISVALPSDAAPTLKQQVVTTLSRAGYPKILFVTARHATAEAKGQQKKTAMSPEDEKALRELNVPESEIQGARGESR